MWWLLLIVCLLSIALLAIPLQVTIIGRPEAQLSATFCLRWLFGIVQLRSDRTGATVPGTPVSAVDKGKPKQRKSQSSGRKASQRGLVYLRASGGTERILRLAKKLSESLRPRCQGVVLEIGLGDSADTGMAWALLGPLSGWLYARFAGEAALQPNFFEERLTLSGKVEFTLVPLRVLLHLFGYLASPYTVRGLIAAWETAP